MQRKQLQENEMLRRMSIIGLAVIPTFVSALNSTIVFLILRQFQQYIASLCSRFMWVGTYHYHPIYQNCATYPKTPELPYSETHNHYATLSYPKTHPKTHNSHTTLPNRTCKTMLSPSKVVAWECGTCAYINEDAMRRNFLACQTRCPICYAIVAGATTAMTARTTRVDRCKQARVAALATAVPAIAGEADTSANAAVAGGRLLPPMGHLLWLRVWPCTRAGSLIGVGLCKHCCLLGQYDGQHCRNLCQREGTQLPPPRLLWNAAPGGEQASLPPGAIDLS